MLAGDTNPWRDVGHATWFDPLAALEDTKGPAFRSVVKTLEAQWEKETAKNRKAIRAWRSRITHFKEAALPLDPAYAHEVFAIPDPDDASASELRIQYAAAHTTNVWIRGVLAYTGLAAFEVDKEAGLYLTLQDIGAGAEQLELAIYRTTQKTPLVRIAPVGPEAAFYGDRVAYLTVENALRYNSVMTVHKTTGKGRRCLYKSKDPRCQLELVERRGIVFVRESNCLQKRIGYLTEHAVRWMSLSSKVGETLIPLSKTAWAENRHLVVDGRRTPLPHGECIEDAAPLSGTTVVVVTVQNACCSLYTFDFLRHSFTPLFCSKTPNQIKLSGHTPDAILSYPNKPTEVRDLRDLRVRLTFPSPLTLPVFKHGFATSSDGTKIPYTIVSHSSRPKKLLVEAYGAYGISARRAYPAQWMAQIERGYAYAVVCPRGGREKGDDWWRAGSTAPRKHRTFEDVYAAIQTIQRRLEIPVGKTAFYGRSAGGWVAARVAQHSPPLCAAVLAEVPYVDVLRTTSNPRLPLTQMEYDEFGDPRRVADYEALLRLSPVDTVPLAFPKAEADQGAPAVLARTGLHDMEVSPYEAVKWITKLQGLGWNAFLGVDESGGHFAAKKQQGIQAAENAAFLDGALSSTPRPYGTPPTRKVKRHSSKGRTFNSTRRRKH
jgi:dienelactone hydrolase